jgi:hypothetical protein
MVIVNNIEQTSEAISSDVTCAGPLSLTISEIELRRRKLYSQRTSVRAKAEQEIRQLGIGATLAIVVYERETNKRMRRLHLRATMMFAVIMTMLTVAACTYVNKTSVLIPPLWFVFYMWLHSITSYKSQNRSARLLAGFDDANAIGELIMALEIPDKEVQAVVRPELVHLLPKLRAADARLVRESHRHMLSKLLQGRLYGKPGKRYADWQADKRLTLAVLKALQQIGDGSSITAVSEVAHGNSRWIDPDVVLAARECLPYLQQKTLDALAAGELLRSSVANDIGVEALPRAAGTMPETREDELLRPTIGH